MQESIELRVNETFALYAFEESEGVSLGDSVRKIRMAAGDERIPAIVDAQATLNAEGKALFFGWAIHRKYTRQELLRASWVTLAVAPSYRLAGDIAGTEYDPDGACPVCGAGRKQVGPLRLRLTELPRVRDIARASSGEWIVTPRFVDAFNSAGGSGASFLAVEFRHGRRTDQPQWYQMVPTAEPVRVHPSTSAGNGPFPSPDADIRYRCPLGDTLGLNRLSELRIQQPAWDMADVNATAEYFGDRRGMFGPVRELVVSGRLRSELLNAGIRGFKQEVAHVVQRDTA